MPKDRKTSLLLPQLSPPVLSPHRAGFLGAFGSGELHWFTTGRLLCPAHGHRARREPSGHCLTGAERNHEVKGTARNRPKGEGQALTVEVMMKLGFVVRTGDLYIDFMINIYIAQS